MKDTIASIAGGYWRLFCRDFGKKVTVAGDQVVGAWYAQHGRELMA
ncbi:hypothetical protein ACCI51_02990 [Microbulbifer echini]|uniref:Uncharacterized protein n=1 Tax=Microbulbifer echini TaxID=1529067 RepID=A0ABV4NKG1_9GAMM|nr:hypothetical protein [uncultured Microbulbifer sp.]